MVRTTIAICCDNCEKVLGGDSPIVPSKCYGKYIDDNGGEEIYFCEECLEKLAQSRIKNIEDRFDEFRSRRNISTKVYTHFDLCGSFGRPINFYVGIIGRAVYDDDDIVIMSPNGKFFRRHQAKELIFNIFDYDYIEVLRNKYRSIKEESKNSASMTNIYSQPYHRDGLNIDLV